MVNNYSWNLDTTYIEHHGIKGMHWYQRLYQNEDGSTVTLAKKYGIELKEGK